MNLSQFQLTRPLRGATPLQGPRGTARKISTHTPLAGRDFVAVENSKRMRDFNSHAPCGARHFNGRSTSDVRRFQLTRPLRGATGLKIILRPSKTISTHTPLAGRDRITPLHMEIIRLFQLTRPLRGATTQTGEVRRVVKNFNSHAPCGARHLRLFFLGCSR